MRYFILLTLLILLSCTNSTLRDDFKDVKNVNDVQKLTAEKYITRAAGKYGDVLGFEIITDCVEEVVIVYTPEGKVKYKEYFKYNEIGHIELMEYARNAIHNK